MGSWCPYELITAPGDFSYANRTPSMNSRIETPRNRDRQSQLVQEDFRCPDTHSRLEGWVPRLGSKVQF